jgi:aspartyl-tRNA(Asn)/glutamyl-tRNA(Gln) amidotransferase subunit B
MEYLPELPLEKERRYVRDFGLSAQHSYFLTSEKKLADYFEEAVRIYPQPKPIANWILVEFGGRLKEKGLSIWQSGVTPQNLAELVKMIQEGVVTSRTAKSVADEMLLTPEVSPRTIVEDNPAYRPFADTEKLQEIVVQVVRENEASVKEVLGGRDRAFTFLVGQVMKKTQGSAQPDLVNRLLREAIAQYPK